MGAKCYRLTAAKLLLHLALRALNYFKMLRYERVLVREDVLCILSRNTRQQSRSVLWVRSHD